MSDGDFAYFGFLYLVLFGLVSLLWLTISNRRLHEPNSESPSFYQETGNGFDSDQVREQVETIREHMGKTDVSAGRNGLKRSIRLAESRQKIAGLSYFQSPHSPPPVEPEEPHHGAGLILV